MPARSSSELDAAERRLTYWPRPRSAVVTKFLVGRPPNRFLRITREQEMSNKPFNKPIYLRLPHDGRFRAWNVWEGLDYLERFWTGPKDINYERAKELCESALDGFTTPSRARGE